MGRLGLAFRIFWQVLRNGEIAARAQTLVLNEPKGPQPSPEATVPSVPVKPPVKKPARSEALTLLATLQRDARLVDFLQEPIAEYNDAQIGAAVRDVHRDCKVVLDRLFGLQPLLEQQEGDSIEIAAGYDPNRYRLSGAVGGAAPFRGVLAHPGWLATRVELPSWSGGESGALVVAPAEVEVK